MSEISHFVVAFEEPFEIGEVLDVAGARGRVVAELTRQEFIDELKTKVLPGHNHRVGTYNFDTKRFEPSTGIPPEMRYFYRCEPL